MDINQSIVDLKTDAIMFAQELGDNNINKTYLDKYRLAELKSNLEALITIIDKYLKVWCTTN